MEKRVIFQHVLLQLLPVAFVYSIVFLYYLALRIFNFQNYSKLYRNLI